MARLGTGGLEGAHVRREPCVVLGDGCACVTWTGECACMCEGVHFRMEWCVGTGHVDMGVRLSGEECEHLEVLLEPSGRCVTAHRFLDCALMGA